MTRTVTTTPGAQGVTSGPCDPHDIVPGTYTVDETSSVNGFLCIDIGDETGWYPVWVVEDEHITIDEEH